MRKLIILTCMVCFMLSFQGFTECKNSQCPIDGKASFILKCERAMATSKIKPKKISKFCICVADQIDELFKQGIAVDEKIMKDFIHNCEIHLYTKHI